jgi:hypothetical protein
MVADDDGLVCVCTVDDADDVPNWCYLLFHEVGESKSSVGCRTGAVYCIQTTNPPISIDRLPWYTIAIQSLQKRQGISVRDWQGRDLGQVWRVADTLDAGL